MSRRRARAGLLALTIAAAAPAVTPVAPLWAAEPAPPAVAADAPPSLEVVKPPPPPAPVGGASIVSPLVETLAPPRAVVAPPPPEPRVASPQGAWRVAPARGDGATVYCTSEAAYSSGHVLIFGRTRGGEVNLALAIPGGAMPAGENWPVTLTVDGKESGGPRTAVAASKTLLVVGLGHDEALLNQLKRGRKLMLTSSADSIGFQLTGAAKALADLEKCVAALPPPKPGRPVVAGEPVFPETLAAVLGAAGLGSAQVVTFPGVPPEQRPADHAWRIGQVLGGMRERLVPAGSRLDELSEMFAQSLSKRCKGDGVITHGGVEDHPGVKIRVSAVDCPGDDGRGALHIALVAYLSEAHLFAIYFHEALPARKAETDEMRDRLADVFRTVANLEPEAAPTPAPATATTAATTPAPAAGALIPPPPPKPAIPPTTPPITTPAVAKKTPAVVKAPVVKQPAPAVKQPAPKAPVAAKGPAPQ